MEPTPLGLFFILSVYLSAAAAIATLITGILFFTVGNPFGKFNDTASIFQMVLTLPVTVLFLRTSPPEFLGWAVITALVGIFGMLAAAYGQVLLVLERIDFETSTRFFPAGAGVGFWLIGVNTLALTAGQLPPVLAAIGMLAGLGYIATVIGFLRGGQKHPLFFLGAFLLGTGYPVWAIWLGKLITSGILR